MQIITKKEKDPLTSRYSFATTETMKHGLDQVKLDLGWDVNEMFRQFGAELLEKARQAKEPKAG